MASSSPSIPPLPETVTVPSSIVYIPRPVRTVHPPLTTSNEDQPSSTETYLIEQLNNHIHSRSCGHLQVQHDGHIDYLVGKILHHPHNDHYDIHGEIDDEEEKQLFLRPSLVSSVVLPSSSSEDNDDDDDDSHYEISPDTHGHATPEYKGTPYRRTNSNQRIDKISRTLSENNNLPFDSPVHLRRRNQRLLKAILAMEQYSNTNKDEEEKLQSTVDDTNKSVTKSSSSSSSRSSSSSSLWYRDRDALRFMLMISLTGSFMLVELIVGVIIQSLSLQADAFHMFGDVLSLGIGYYSMRLARLPRNHNHPVGGDGGGNNRTTTNKNSTTVPNHFSFGYVRMEVIGSLVNGVFLLAICLQIGIEGIQRIVDTATSSGTSSDHDDFSLTNPGQSMMIVGGIGLGINLIGLVLFGGHGGGHGHSHHDHGGGHGHSHGHSHGPPPSSSTLENTGTHGHSHQSTTAKREGNMNMHGVFLHVLGDALGSVGVVISGALMYYTTWPNREYADPLCSLIIIGIIMFGTFPLVRHAIRMLLQRTPDSINVDLLRKDILSLDGVLSVHDLHVWQLSEKSTIASMHVLLDRRIFSWRLTVDEIKLVLHRYGVHASTVQPEFVSSDVQAKLEAAANVIAQQQELLAEEEKIKITIQTSTSVASFPPGLPDVNQKDSTDPVSTHTGIENGKAVVVSSDSRIGSNNNSVNNTTKSYLLSKELTKLLAMDTCNEPVCSSVCEEQSCCPVLTSTESLPSGEKNINTTSIALAFSKNKNGNNNDNPVITTASAVVVPAGTGVDNVLPTN